MDKKKKIILLISIILAAVLVIGAAVIITVSLLNNNGNTDEPPILGDGAECGTYYLSVGNTECELSLIRGEEFKLTYNGNTDSGRYTLVGSALTLDFELEGKEDIVASYEGGVITLTLDGVTMRMLKKVNYTVKFETNGGSAIAEVTVINGKTVAKPNDPTRENFIFVGWYKDSEYKTPYTFGADIVTSDITIYARWIEDTGAREYTISFDLGYEGAEVIADRGTLGGKLFDPPAPSRDNYTFHGWWISTDNDSAALSYKYTEDVVFTEDTTLFAVWREKGSTKALPPSLKLDDGVISWGGVSGVRSYEITVTDESGVAVFTKSVSTTSVQIPFSDLAPGVYRIKVKALANTGDGDNSESYYTYVNKGLGKVTGLFVSGESTLVFEGVEGAQKYLITVVCGNSAHNHTDYDNGLSKTFSFANCPMGEDGIKFVVKAVAEGYLPSVSDEFIYKRELDSVSGLEWREDTGVVVWSSVEGAVSYFVSVECGDSQHNHGFVSVGGATSVDIRVCAPKADGIVVKVYPFAEGYIIPAPSEITVNKSSLRTPDGITVNGTVIGWDRDPDAEGYEISVNGEIYNVSENSFDIGDIVGTETGAAYEIRLRATGEVNSAWSDPIATYFGALVGELKYSKNTLSWNHAIGAEFYEVQVNDGEITRIYGDSFAKITLDRAGENTVKVRFAKGDFTSEWLSLSLTAYSVAFDTLGGSSVPTQYKTASDSVELPGCDKSGYDFISWYNVPGGPEVNGKEIDGALLSITENVTFYAYYTPKEYEITYNYGLGGSGLGKTDKVKYDRDYVLEIPTSSDITVAFGGWFSAPYGSGTQYTDGSGKSLVPWGVLGGAELYAFWIDETLAFESVKVNGKDAYSVSAGPRISLVTSVTVPTHHNGLPVLMIDGGAFMGCSALEKVNIPASVEVISNVDPFLGCESLTDINVYDVEGFTSPRYKSCDGVLFENKADGTALVRMPLGKGGEYVIPGFVSEISEGAFSNSSLTSVTVSCSVAKIGNDAFLGAAALKSVSFAASDLGDGEVELTIGKRAFASCDALTSINLPSRLSSIELSKYYISPTGSFTVSEDHAFVGCDSLESIGIEKGSDAYSVLDGMICSADGGQLLFCPVAKSGEVKLRAGIQPIGAGAFIGCDNITELVIPSSTTYIGEYAFYGLSMERVTFGGKGFSSVTVGDNAFEDCEKLKSVVFETGSQISVIGERAFSGCTSLESFTITQSVTLIRDSAFEDCTGLKSVTFDGGKNSLEFGKNIFYNCRELTTVEIPANVTVIPSIFAGCTSLTEVKVADGSSCFASEGGVVFNKDKTEIIYYPEGKSGAYLIPECVTSIAPGVFKGNKVISELVIPASVSYIGEEAFLGTKIGKIIFEEEDGAEPLTIAKSAFRGAYFEGYDFILPSRTQEIGDYAFAEIYYQSITLNEGVKTLGAYAFYCPSNDNGVALVIPASVISIGEYCFSGESFDYSITTVNRFFDVLFTEESSKLTTIGDYAFYKNARLSSVKLPDSVKTIGNYAFYECTGLVSVKLSASLEAIGAYAFAASANTYKVPIGTITIPAGVSTIGARAFENCQNLTKVDFEGSAASPDLFVGATYLRSYKKDGMELFSVERGNVFASCTKLTEVNLSANVTTLGEYSFLSAGDIGFAVNLPDDSRLATIGAFCFYKSRLESFRVPATVRNLAPIEEYGAKYDRLGIGAYAFAASSGRLTEIIFLKSADSYPLTIGCGAFENQSRLEAIELPARLASYTSAGGEIIPPLADGPLVFYGATSLSEITTENEDGAYKVVGGVLYTKDMRELVFCPIAYQGEVDVPSTVTKIHSYAFMGCTELTAVNFDSDSELRLIGDYAFYGCHSITDITLPTGVASVGEGAFSNAVSLESITLPKSLTSFDISTLDGCSSLVNVFVDEENSAFFSEDGVLYNKEMTSLILYPRGRTDEEYTIADGVISIGINAFKANKYIATVILPEGLVEINNGAFLECYSLNTVVIPATVQMIGNDAFASTESLEYLEFEMGGDSALIIGAGAFKSSGVRETVLPARMIYIGVEAFFASSLDSLGFEPSERYMLTEIGDRAFSGTLLASVQLPNGVATVGNGVFSNCMKLESVVFGIGLEKVGEGAFSDSTVVNVSFPASLKTLGAYAFSGCTRLKTVSFGKGSMLESIAKGTFMGCTSLESITIPAYVKAIGGASDSGAFLGCTSLKSVIFLSGDNCTVIDDYAFSGCTALQSFDIPLSVGTLGSYAFSGCTSLPGITVHRATTKLGKGIFSGCTSLASVELNTGADTLPEEAFLGCEALTHIYIPANIEKIGKNCFAGSSVERFEVARENRSLVSIDGVIFTAGKTAVIYFPPKSPNTTLFIPKEVVEIAPGNFEGNTSIKDVIFEEGGTTPLTIGEKAFLGCYGLRSIELPERLISIGAYAFKECYALTSITIPKNVKEIGDYAFTWCYKLYEVKNESAIENIGSYGSILTAQPSVNIYTPTEGESVLVREGDYLFATVAGTKTLIGYIGNDSVITLPSGEYYVAEYLFYKDKSITGVIIPDAAGIDFSVSSAFTDCTNLEYIYLKATSAPSSWDSGWCGKAKVICGYTGEEITYSFVADGAAPIPSVTSAFVIKLPIPERDGYVLLGWYDNAEFSGTAVGKEYYSSEKTTLYAKLVTEDEYINDYLFGQTMEYAYAIESGSTYNVKIKAGKDQNYYVLTVEAGEIWNITTIADSGDHKIWIYDEDGNEILAYDKSYRENYNHTFTDAGTYYIGIGFRGSKSTGDFEVRFTKH